MNGPLTGQQEGVENRVTRMADGLRRRQRALSYAEHGTRGGGRPSATTTRAGAEHESAVPPQSLEARLDLLGNRIAELSARIQAATYELLRYLREFDRHHGWEGFRSCAHWLNWRLGLDLGAAREKSPPPWPISTIFPRHGLRRLAYSMVRALLAWPPPTTRRR